MDQEPEITPPAGDAQRIWMDRARDNAGRVAERLERPWWPRLLGLAMSLALVGVVMLGFHSFLTALGGFLDTPVTAPSAGAAGAPGAESSMPVFVVPTEDAAGDGQPPGDAQVQSRE